MNTVGWRLTETTSTRQLLRPQWRFCYSEQQRRTFATTKCFVNLDTCLCDQDRIHAARIFQVSGIQPPTLVPLMAARTTGNQGINRSELFAIVKVFDHFEQGVIFSDSATSLVRIAECRHATTLGQLGHLSDFDLVRRVWTTPHLAQFDLFKIKAHVDPHTVPDLLVAYRCLGNQVVNDRAIHVCWHLFPELVQEYWAVHLESHMDMEYLEQYFH